MKIRLFTFVAIFAFCFFTQESTIVRVTNNTNKDINVAYVYFDKERTEYVSKGWYKVSPFSDRDINLGAYQGKFYIHANTRIVVRYNLVGEPIHQLITWGNGYTFCADDKAFQIRDADIVNCSRKEKFSAMELKTGINYRRFDP